MTERSEPTRAEIQAHVDDLERETVTDRQSIADLQAELVVDRELITHLEAGGLIDREKIANLETALVAARRIGVAMGIHHGDDEGHRAAGVRHAAGGERKRQPQATRHR